MTSFEKRSGSPLEGESEPGLGKEERMKDIAGRAKAAFLSSLKGKTFTIFNEDTMMETPVVATGNIDGQGYPFVKEPAFENSKIVSAEKILHSPEGRIMIDQILRDQNLSGDEIDKALKLLGF